MNILVLDKKSDAMSSFDRAEWKQYDLEHFGKEIEWDTKLYYLKAEDEHGIVGTMELRVEGGVGKVNTLLIAKRSQRQGVGKALMQKEEEITIQHNGHKIFLLTGKDWEAVQFYKTLGYKKTAEVNNHFFHVNFIELSKFLAG